MHRLVLKDLRSSILYLLLVLAFYLLHAPVNFKLFAGCLIANIAVTFFLATGVTFIDWHYDTDSLIGCLPLRRSRIIGGRHLTALVALGIGFLTCFAYAALPDALIAPERATASILLSFDGVAAFVVVIASLVSVLFPLHFRLGVGRGWMAFGVLAVVGCALLTRGIRLCPPSGERFGRIRPARVADATRTWADRGSRCAKRPTGNSAVCSRGARGDRTAPSGVDSPFRTLLCATGPVVLKPEERSRRDLLGFAGPALPVSLRQRPSPLPDTSAGYNAEVQL